MSLFGSLSTSVSALSAQSQAIAMTANNIANVSTTGYKRKEAAFSSIVTTDARNARYSPGSVQSKTIQKVDGQGGLQQTSSTTDIAVSGNGFFVVQKSATGLQEKFYTRSGAFSEDSSGYLKNTSGYYLMGWPLATDGSLPAGMDDLSSLQSVDVAFLGGLTRATQTTSMSLNLDSTEGPESYPVSTSAPADFSRTVRVYDTLGAGEDVKVEFIHHDSPTDSSYLGNGLADMDLSDTLVSKTGVTAGDVMSFTVGSVTVNYTVTSTATVSDLISSLNNNSSFSAVGVADLTNGDIYVRAKGLSDTVTIANVTGTSGTALGMTNPATPTTPTQLLTAEGAFNPYGWWQVTVRNATTDTILKQGDINFNSDGTINALQDADGEIKFTVSNINWANGSELQDIDFKIPNITQFAGTYNVISTSQDGAELGLRTGIEINNAGQVIARFSNGQTSAIYQLPIATFTSPNGLSEVSGNAYSQTVDSGSFNLKQAGEGGAGVVQGSALESSNVDIADEFTKMIVIQRAYSAGTKVIRTVDDMTEELLRLR